MNLFQEFEERKIDYRNVQAEFSYVNTGLDEEVDVSIIIPVNGRGQFNSIISDAFLKAILKTQLKISLIFVEHSEKMEHHSLCSHWVSYIWIPQNGQRFNKCLCFNFGVLNCSKAKYYLFHDSDILVPENFFELLFENMKGHDAVQAFSGQRLFHCSHDLTETLLNGALPVELLSTNTIGVTPARAGAEGGSIFCTKELLLQVGGFPDWGFSEYSVEDSYFFRSLQLHGNVGYCNNPPVDCFHLWHEPSYNRQTKQEDWNRYYSFMAMKEDGRKHMTKLMSDHFKKYFNE
jgi:hypothetical protein